MADPNQVLTLGGLAVIAVGILCAVVVWLFKRSIDASDKRFDKFEARFEKQNGEFLASFKELATDLKALTYSIVEHTAWRSMTDCRLNDLQAKQSELHQRFTNVLNDFLKARGP